MRGTMVLGLLGSIGLVLAGCQKKADEPQPEPSPKAAARETPPAPTPPPAPAPKSGTELAEAYTKCMTAWNAKDENTVASCWAENASAEVVDFGQPAVTGRKEIIDKLNRPNWTAFPDGKYRVRAELTGNWGESMVQIRVGYRRIEPLAWYVVLTPERHLESVSFDVVYEPWHWRP